MINVDLQGNKWEHANRKRTHSTPDRPGTDFRLSKNQKEGVERKKHRRVIHQNRKTAEHGRHPIRSSCRDAAVSRRHFPAENPWSCRPKKKLSAIPRRCAHQGKCETDRVTNPAPENNTFQTGAEKTKAQFGPSPPSKNS